MDLIASSAMTEENEDKPMDGLIGFYSWLHYICITILALRLLSTLLVLALTKREPRHRFSIASISPQIHCDYEEDGCIRLLSWLYYIFILLFALCLLSTLCVMNQFLFWLIYLLFLLFPVEHSIGSNTNNLWTLQMVVYNQHVTTKPLR